MYQNKSYSHVLSHMFISLSQWFAHRTSVTSSPILYNRNKHTYPHTHTHTHTHAHTHTHTHTNTHHHHHHLSHKFLSAFIDVLPALTFCFYLQTLAVFEIAYLFFLLLVKLQLPVKSMYCCMRYTCNCVNTNLAQHCALSPLRHTPRRYL